MKKLFLMMLITLVVGCGTEPECECDDIARCFDETKDDFFETYYTECVSWCETCSTWAQMCDLELTKDACVKGTWERFIPIHSCGTYEEYVLEWLSNDDCLSWETVHDYCDMWYYGYSHD